MARIPISVQLRYLQTLKEIAAEHNSTSLFPTPIDILEIFMDLRRRPIHRYAEPQQSGETPPKTQT